jgi:magnesium-transporting ATPase (P-type)
MADGDEDRDKSKNWHAMDCDAALQALDSAPHGISRGEAEHRLQVHGPNELSRGRGRPWWRRLLEQFNNVLIILLIIAGVVSAILGHWVDAAAIFGVVIINAAVGFIQEGKAEKALEQIRGMLSPQATVQRDDKRQTIPAEQLVPGDVVVVESGDRIPADIRLLDGRQFRTQEAALTGESEPVDKQVDPVQEDAPLAERRSMAFAGTLCVQGTAKGLVVATGVQSQIGRISEMIESVEQIQTPLLRQLDHFAKVLAGVIVAVAAAMAIFAVLVYGQSAADMFMASVGLAVAAIPQGLPAIVTITLALGVQAMARRNAVIRRLPAVETLGSISTIFADKTGTLTRNEMTLQVVALPDGDIEISGVGFAPEGEFRRKDSEEKIEPQRDELLNNLLIASSLCNESVLQQSDEGWRIDGDPTEGALVVAAAKAGHDAEQLRRDYQRVDVIPFESERKYMATLDQAPNSDARTIHVKGAPDVIVELCDRQRGSRGDERIDLDAWQQRIDELSSRGLRVLAVAKKSAEGQQQLDESVAESGLVLLGVVGLLDPPREAAIEAIARCREAGIQAKMVTGDHALTARAIGERLGLPHTETALTGKDIEDSSETTLCEQIESVDVFARAAPEHKLRLVKAVQSRGRVCAMTGDGVNDAPALKRADVGVAMGVQGTEAAKEAAEMVLADDNFASIVNAVEEGRRVYDNIRKTITFLLPTNGAESLAILIAVLLNTALPVTPVQILWVNMVTAVTLGLALAFEAGDPDLMKRRPRDPEAPILNRFLLWRVIFVSLLLVAPVYGSYLWLQGSGLPVEVARSAAVNMLVVGEMVYLVNTRFPLTSSLTMRGLFGSRPVLIALALVAVFQLLWTYTGPMQFLFGSAALSGGQWGIIWAAGLGIFLAVELEKALWRSFGTNRNIQE